MSGVNPDYCSSLDAVAPVEAKVIEKASESYLDALESDLIQQQAEWPTVTVLDYMTATALQRATACVKAWEGKDE